MFNRQNSLFYMLTKRLKENNSKVDLKELTFQMQRNPSYSSSHFLSGVLDHFNIRKVTLEVPNVLKMLA